MGAPPRRGRAHGTGDTRRRRKLAESLAVPLPLGAAVDDHEEWSEDQLQQKIISLGKTLDGKLQQQHPCDPAMRLLIFHDTDSRLNVAGLPDILAVGPGGQIWAELKRQSRRAQARPEQKIWLAALAAGGASVFLWRPEDWIKGTIQNELYRISRPRPGRNRAVAPAPATPAWMKCGCPAGTAPVAHTCPAWGPPPAR